MGYRFMHKIFISFAVGMLAIAPAMASDKTDVMAVVHKWGSTDADTCADEVAIVDSVPPYEWHGSGACSKWRNDYDAFNKQAGATDGHAVVGKARHIEITADHAYVVAPVTYFFKQGEKEMQEQATGTFVLVKSASGWHITGWTYSP
jgi:hypothetical protein